MGLEYLRQSCHQDLIENWVSGNWRGTDTPSRSKTREDMQAASSPLMSRELKTRTAISKNNESFEISGHKHWFEMRKGIVEFECSTKRQWQARSMSSSQHVGEGALLLKASAC
jgi:hypothetical protein